MMVEKKRKLKRINRHNEILLRSYDIELTRSFFSKKFCCLTKRMVENILGNFCKTNFEIFEQNRAAILRENWKIGRAKTPKCSTPFFCQGTKFRAETTSVSEISVAMQQDALLSFWPTSIASSLLGSALVISLSVTHFKLQFYEL